MILTREEIINRGLILNPSKDGFGKVSNKLSPIGYNLTVGDVYFPREDRSIITRIASHFSLSSVTEIESGDAFVIPPQGMIVVVSQEKVRMPAEVCAYALPKTSLSEEGLLILNTGIIDPHYEGFISGTLINFRKTNYTIKRGSPFLRLVFEQVGAISMGPHDASPTTHQPRISAKTQVNQPVSINQNAITKMPDSPGVAPAQAAPVSLSPEDETIRQNYTNEKIKKAQDYPSTFLNVPRTVETVTTLIMRGERNRLAWIAAIAAAFFAILTAVTSLTPKYVYSERDVSDDVIAKLQQKDGQLLSEERTVQTLQKAVSDLQTQVSQMKAVRQIPILPPPVPGGRGLHPLDGNAPHVH